MGKMKEVLQESLGFGRDLNGADLESEYALESDIFVRTGSPLQGWKGYFVCGLGGQFAAAMMGTIGARLYLHGFGDYWGSFWTTISERHAVTYFEELRTVVQAALDSTNSLALAVLFVVDFVKNFVQ